MLDPQTELVRIDKNGEAHAIGRVASQRLRERAGVFRMLPAPVHVVFMRYTGADGRRDEEDGAVVRLSGEISQPGALCDVLAMVAQTGWRGELVVLTADAERSLFFDQGNVLGVSTTVGAERLGEVMLRVGAVTEEQHGIIEERVSNGERYGESAIELSILSREQVFDCMRHQIQEVTVGALLVGDGTFFFLDGLNESKVVSARALSANGLLMDAIARMDEMRYFRVKIPSGAHVPSVVEGREPSEPVLLACWKAIDGKRSVEEVGRLMTLGEFEVTKHLYALVQSKRVVIHPPRARGGNAAIVETANEGLRRLFAIVREQGRDGELRATLSHFAASGGLYDILFRDAGPNEEGELSAARVARNAVVAAHGGDAEGLLKQLFYDYLAFALFTAGGLVGVGLEEEMKSEVAPLVATLRPPGQ
jgi:hypothetical protein